MSASSWPGGALALAAVLALAACAAPRHPIEMPTPTSARPQPQPVAARPTGAIYPGGGYRPLFEDRRPRLVGDLLTIVINEKLDASQKANATTERSSEVSATLPEIRGIVPGVSLNPVDLAARGGSAFDGKGENASSNTFTGTISVTVVEVLANGNLRVAGEKQIGVRQNSEVLKFSGVVDPAQIQPGNTVSSTQVADARLDYRGGGYVEEALVQGWLARFFNSFSPF